MCKLGSHLCGYIHTSSTHTLFPQEAQDGNFWSQMFIPEKNDSIVQRTRCSLVWPRVTLIPRPVELGGMWTFVWLCALNSYFQRTVSNWYLLKANKVRVVTRPRARVYVVTGLHLACGVLSGEWVPQGYHQIGLLGSVESLCDRGRDRHSAIKTSDPLWLPG